MREFFQASWSSNFENRPKKCGLASPATPLGLVERGPYFWLRGLDVATHMQELLASTSSSFLESLGRFFPPKLPRSIHKKKHTCKDMSVGKTIHQFNTQYHPIQILQKNLSQKSTKW